jgi:hypothetical protein
MTTKDDRITEALSAADKRLLEDMEEPAFFWQLIGLFRGRNAWVTAVVTVVQMVMFLIAVWCGWRFFLTDDVLTALRWGLPAVTLAIVATQLKMSVMAQLQADRVIAALHQHELRVRG